MHNWRHERDLFFIALAFLTRIPIPATTPYTNASFNSSARYFPLVGALVGSCGALIFFAAQTCWPLPLAVALSMAATVLITGAFHEDGFADSCDGFGGGWRREQVLEIMKDSRIGSYAAVGLLLLLAIKFLGLSSLTSPGSVVRALIIGHTWSRLLVISYLVDMNYARDDDTSKIKPLATRLSRNEWIIAALSAIPFLCLVELRRTAFMLVVLLAWRWLFGRYMQRRLGGFTGDCLGCAQQVAEVLIYLVLAAGVGGHG